MLVEIEEDAWLTPASTAKNVRTDLNTAGLLGSEEILAWP
jgi:hypothetical protein